MKTGRPPLPTRLKVLRGTLRKHRRNLAEPMPPSGAPPMPRTLPVAARPAWRWLVRLLRAMRVITKADGPVLVLAACRLTDYLEYRRDVDTHGATFTTTTTTGSMMVRRRPEVELMTAAWRDAMQALGQLGLTPSMRSRVSSVPQPSEPEDELEGFLASRRGAP
jgi:P27 family predicted phage terminase small subunit